LAAAAAAPGVSLDVCPGQWAGLRGNGVLGVVAVTVVLVVNTVRLKRSVVVGDPVGVQRCGLVGVVRTPSLGGTAPPHSPPTAPLG